MEALEAECTALEMTHPLAKAAIRE